MINIQLKKVGTLRELYIHRPLSMTFSPDGISYPIPHLHFNTWTTLKRVSNSLGPSRSIVLHIGAQVSSMLMWNTLETLPARDET